MIPQPRPGSTPEHQPPQITDVWHACQIDNANQLAANFYVGLVVVAVLVLLLWIAYRRDCRRY